MTRCPSPPDGVSCRACAKINLFLNITGRRADGYHCLRSLMAFVSVGDDVFITSDARHCDGRVDLGVEGPFGPQTPTGPDNLALMAAHSMMAMMENPPHIRLRLVKNIPPGGGLGGGSADAAAVMQSLGILWDIDMSRAATGRVALSLGADVPFFVGGKVAYVSGVGERVTPVSALPPLGVVLVNPRQALSTKAVFERYAQSASLLPGSSRQDEDDAGVPTWPRDPHHLAESLKPLGNDLTDAACDVMPALKPLLERLAQLEGVLLARMSGSGATCFALFDDKDKADHAAIRLRQNWPDLWVMATTLLSRTPPVMWPCHDA